ncbi:MAG: asparagine--tRNA ligase [Silvanigrellales bacterium]|jgi:asparaginyl-tRNA synthetase|nr:asparagine--tRNA ligase [Silvanigrellales bacterium]
MALKDAFTPLAHIHAGQVAPGPIAIAGWVRTRRGSKKFSFIDLNDGSSPKGIQVIADAVLPNYETDIARLSTGAAVIVKGLLVESPGQGQRFEIQAKDIEVTGFADPETFALQKKEMSFEYLREVAHMRGRTATFSSMFRLRSVVSLAIHRFFEAQGFSYIHAPILTTNDGEGAGETFKVTTLDLNAPPRGKDGKVDFSKDFFGRESMLCVTGQLEAEALAMGLGKVYTFGPTFRAENSNTSRHLAEFWMVEPEMAFWDLDDTMALGEGLIRAVVREVFEKCEGDLEILAQKAEQDARPYLRMALEQPFVRVSYTEAVEVLQKAISGGKTFEYPVSWGGDLKSEHERYLCEVHFKAPTIVYNYPEELKAFYMYLNDDGKTVRAMDCLMPGIGEVIGGSQREDRLDVLERRMRSKGIDSTHLEWYLDLRRFGGVPHAGFGLGFERLLMWISGFGNIRDVIPFPRVPGSCLF